MPISLVLKFNFGSTTLKFEIHFNNETIKIYHFPDAHTSGDSYEEIVTADPLNGLLTEKKYIPDSFYMYSVYYGNWKNN